MSATERVATNLYSRLRRHEWGVGEQLPPLADLATEYETSIPTIHRAQRMLIDQGILRAAPGVGVFVHRAPPAVDSDAELREAVDQINDQIESAIQSLTAAKAQAQALDARINRSTV